MLALFACFACIILSTIVEESIEEVVGIVRTWRGFGVVLDGEDGFIFSVESLEALIEQRDVGCLQLFW